MVNRRPYGNLTAALVVIAVFELVLNRAVGHLFLSPGCRTVAGCLALRAGPFLLYLTGLLALTVVGWGVGAHLLRGELFPRGMRITVLALTLVFLLLVGASLVSGRMPERYHTHLETSFGFVVALLVLSFLGSTASSSRTRAGFVLFALPVLLHDAALLSSRAGWLDHGIVTAERLNVAGEAALLLAAALSPLLLAPAGFSRSRLVSGLGLAAGVSGFFFVALFERSDLVQTIGLYTVHLELPRALTPLGIAYTVALFGYVTALAALLSVPGAPRLVGLGMALLGVAGYQIASPIDFALALSGLIAIATGLLRAGSPAASPGAQVTTAAWRQVLATVSFGIADPLPDGSVEPPRVEIVPGPGPAPVADAAAIADGEGTDTATVTTKRRGRPVLIRIRREHGRVRELEVAAGVRPASAPTGTIEAHEAWLARRPDERSPLPRLKTGEAAFDRKIGVYGRAPLGDRGLRRRILPHAALGTFELWGAAGSAAANGAVADGTATGAARFIATSASASSDGRAQILPPSGSAAGRALIDVIDLLLDLVDASAGEAAEPPPAT